MNKTKKLVITGLASASLLSALAVISCGSSTNGGSDNGSNTGTGSQSGQIDKNKEILLAVDGPQQGMYDHVVAEFAKSESYKLGYRIRLIKKDVFGALDTFVGHTDRNVVPDLFYAPQDRITDLAQRNVVSDLDTFDKSLFDDVLAVTGASSDEKTQARTFGTVVGANEGDKTFSPVRKLFGIRHNQEAIVLASTKELAGVKADMANDKTNTLEDLVKSGEAFIRLQDFWYGNGVLNAGIMGSNPSKMSNELITKILYSEKGKITSGFLKTNANHEAFKKGIAEAAKIYFPIWQAAYNTSDEAYKTTVWGKKGIEKGSLQKMLSNDMGAVQAEIWALMKQRKFNYAIVGTWDIQNALKSADAKSFVNIGETSKGNQYVQAAGSWSYLINARNNGAHPTRVKALKEILKLIFSKESYYQYFKTDSKVPFYLNSQSEVKKLQGAEATLPKQKLDAIMKEAGISSLEDLYKEYEKQAKSFDELKAYSANGWSVEKDPKNPLDSKNEEAAVNLDATKFKEIEASKVTEYNKNFGKTTGLRNAVAGILGVDLDKLKGNNEPWQVGFDILKEGLKFDAEAKDDKNKFLNSAKQTENSLHVRKIEKFIFGVDGDSQSDKDEFDNKVVAALKENKLAELKAEALTKAKQVSGWLAKTSVTEEVIKKAVDLYFNFNANRGLLIGFVNDYVKNAKFVKADKTKTNLSLQQVSEAIAEYEKSLAVDKVLNVVTSTKTIAEGGLGILKTGTRVDGSNPQFGSVAWGVWNDQTFGSKPFLIETPALKADNVTLQQFTDAVEEQLHNLYKQKIEAINSTSSGNIVLFTK
ncbi:hypothetical protein [Mycoplasmopsis alligatoris]|uniref:Lipoprotein n=1 Tax=Mycoplasmopsis alligatoris A21JP2 TaxID=747682 RepID=D4XWN6_9BACT|nr:hypothetical protein [Mycoplasmopsis alligatoris]EFF41305.1 conserved hypothetical protein [Mycoplasmopsis alligatoris A21JP2]